MDNEGFCGATGDQAEVRRSDETGSVAPLKVRPAPQIRDNICDVAERD